MISKLRKDPRGDLSGMIPLFVMVGALVLVTAGFFTLNQFVLTETNYPDDQGIYIDEKDVTFGDPYATLEIEGYGNIKIYLDESKAPEAAGNFITLCKEGFYDGLIFHRVIPGFMIQGGDPSGDGTGGPGYTLPSEADNGLTHDRGAISCAKRGDETRMSGSQFFIVHQDAKHLDFNPSLPREEALKNSHTVFGHVVEGMDVIDAIPSTQTHSHDRPIDPVMIQRAYISYE